MMYMVVLPTLWYFLEDGRMTEVVRWAVGKMIAAGHREAPKVQGVENEGEGLVEEVVECDGEKGGDAEMYEKGYVIDSLEETGA